METIEGTSCVCNIVHPLFTKTIHFGYGGVKARGVETYTNFLRFRYHHMTIHKDAWNALMDTRKDWSTYMVGG